MTPTPQSQGDQKFIGCKTKEPEIDQAHDGTRGYHRLTSKKGRGLEACRAVTLMGQLNVFTYNERLCPREKNNSPLKKLIEYG